MIYLTVIGSFVIGISITNAIFFPNVYPQLKLESLESPHTGDPLFITPFLEHASGSIEIAQKRAQVRFTESMGFKSYAGFLTVDREYGSNLFFWYFPPLTDENEAPLVLWLQGGPGGSSLFGLFAEVGPLIANKDAFAVRKYHWALKNHLIFIDNPVGAGFSFTRKQEGYCTNEQCVAIGLYSAMQQFLTLFPNLRDNVFFIAGESYAGKFIPSFAMEILTQNTRCENDDEFCATSKINLKGMAIGNGWCDPVNQIHFGNVLYHQGLIDENQKSLFNMYEDKIIQLIHSEQWAEANRLLNKLMSNGAEPSYFKMFTGMNNYYNILHPFEQFNASNMLNLLSNNHVRKNLHVGGLPFQDGKQVSERFTLDMLKSVAHDIVTLLSHYKIVFYNGQLDIIVAYPMTVNFLSKLKFPMAYEYRNASRYIWKVGNDLAGYVKHAGNLVEVLVRNAGHMVPLDQPKWALDLITRVVNDNF